MKCNQITNQRQMKGLLTGPNTQGSKDCYLLGQNTTCTFSGYSPLWSFKTTLKQQLNSETLWQCWWQCHLSPHCQVYMIMRELSVWLTNDSGGGSDVFPHTAGCNYHPVVVAAGRCRKTGRQGAGCAHILSSQGWRGHVNQVKVHLCAL